MDLLKEAVWTEKYRPTTLDGVVGEHKQKIKAFLENPASFPNLLLVSKEPGTGKTTTAKALINELKSSYLILNASDDRGIDVIRQQIKSFARTMGIENKRKIIFLDEADNLTKDAQMALRTIMEDYSKNTIFIVSCNFENKLIDPLKNRCVIIRFSKPKVEEIKQFLINICNKEEVSYELQGIDKLIEKNYPSIRACINTLQELKMEKKQVTVSNLTSISNMETFINLLKGKKLQELITSIYNNSLNVLELNTFLWNYLITNDLATEYSTNMSKKSKLIQILADNERDFATSADEKIVFASRLSGLMEVFG